MGEIKCGRASGLTGLNAGGRPRKYLQAGGQLGGRRVPLRRDQVDASCYTLQPSRVRESRRLGGCGGGGIEEKSPGTWPAGLEIGPHAVRIDGRGGPSPVRFRYFFCEAGRSGGGWRDKSCEAVAVPRVRSACEAAVSNSDLTRVLWTHTCIERVSSHEIQDRVFERNGGH